jgi:hypothetical protein
MRSPPPPAASSPNSTTDFPLVVDFSFSPSPLYIRPSVQPTIHLATVDLTGNTGLGERAIRCAVRSWLVTTADPGALVRDELKVGSARVDLARIGSRLEGFEIKSDFDTLDRLPRQVEAFSALFDSMTLVVGERFAHPAAGLVPRWWGIKAARAALDGEVRFRVLRPGSQNPNQSVEALAQMLWRTEALDALQQLADLRAAKSWTARQLRERLVASVPIESLHRFVVERIRDPSRMDAWLDLRASQASTKRRPSSFRRATERVPATACHSAMS